MTTFAGLKVITDKSLPVTVPRILISNKVDLRPDDRAREQARLTRLFGAKPYIVIMGGTIVLHPTNLWVITRAIERGQEVHQLSEIMR